MKLSELVKNIKIKDIINNKDVEVSGISYNSKTTNKGEIFVCLKGEHTDGHAFAKMAVERGASVLFCEKALDFDVPQILVESTRHQIAELAVSFYNSPSKNIN